MELVRAEVSDAIQVFEEKIGNYTLQGAIYAAAKLGISDLLRDGPKSYEEIASKLGADPRVTAKTMRFLSDNGIYTETSYGVFALNDIGRLLETGISRENVVRTFEVSRPVGHDLLYTLKTGASAFRHVHGMGWYELVDKDDQFATDFIQWMANQTASASPSILSSYDFSPYNTVVDVGGNIGYLLAAILKAHPKARGILFDRSTMMEKGREFMKKEGLLDRCELISGDFLKQVPEGADLYIIKWVLTDWEDRDFHKILRNCHLAMKPNGRVLIIEWLLEEGTEPSPARGLDLWMTLIGMSGCRTVAEVNKLLIDAGFKPSKPIRTASGFTVTEGIRV